MKHIVFIGNTAWSMYNFRKSVFQAFIEEGYSVVVCSPEDGEYDIKLIELGCEFVPLKISSKGVNPITDFILMISIIRILKRIKPNLCFFYTIKPVIYGSIAASFLKIPHIAITTGLGYTFIVDNVVSKIAKFLYKVSLRKAKEVWFLNNDDRAAFLRERLIHVSQAHLLKGEGVNVEQFQLEPLPSNLSFILLARMLWDKGVGVYVDAARIVKEKHKDVKFKLLGFIGVDNPSAIPQKTIEDWCNEGVVEYLGSTSDVRPYIKESSCVALPSYYGEGVPFCLMEGAAMGRPLVTTNSVGCKDTVDSGITGFLCEPQSVESLVEAFEKTISLSHEQMTKMGLQGRQKMIGEFDLKLVIKKYLYTLDRY